MIGYGIFALIVIILAGMDSLAFHRKHDNGFWSLKTKGKTRFDAWHVGKWIILLLIAIILIGTELYELCGAYIISLVGHQVFLHFIFKPKEKK